MLQPTACMSAMRAESPGAARGVLVQRTLQAALQVKRPSLGDAALLHGRPEVREDTAGVRDGVGLDLQAGIVLSVAEVLLSLVDLEQESVHGGLDLLGQLRLLEERALDLGPGGTTPGLEGHDALLHLLELRIFRHGLALLGAGALGVGALALAEASEDALAAALALGAHAPALLHGRVVGLLGGVGTT